MLIVAEPRLLENILAEDAGGLRVEVLSGMLGSGKTSILRYLEGSGGSRRAVRVPLEDFDPGHPGERGEDASVGAVQGSFHQLAQLLQHLIGELRPEERDELSVVARDARNSQVTNAKVADLQASLDELKEALAPQALADAWRLAARVVGKEFVRRWNAATSTTPCLLLLDNFHAIADQEIGGWLTVQVLPALTGTVVVLTEDSGGSFPALPMDARVSKIHNFDRRTVERWLTLEVDEPVPEDVARKVYEVSQGHPATLSLVRELLWGPDVGSADERRDLLHHLPDQLVERGAELAERLVERQGDDLMRRALQAAAGPRHFDIELLHHLLGKDLERTKVIDVFRRLARYSFVEDLSGNGSRIRLHSFIRQGVLDRMATFDIPAFKDLNERAAEYYAAMLRDEEDAEHPYTSAFVYEDQDWQVKKREWLVHRGQAARPAERRDALVDFSKMFLEAFWWWGNYIHFEFCDQLVADLHHLVEHHRGPTERIGASGRRLGGAWPQLTQLHEALRRILTGYPLRSVKPHQAAWGDVRDALLVVAEVCGLSLRLGRPDSDGLEQDERAVAAILNVLLAHTYRYEQREGDDADRYYLAAAALFTGWSKPWALFERADMHLDQGRLSEVDDLRSQSADLVQPAGKPLDDPDEELIANLHRLRADQHFLAGDLDAAAASYGRAVLHAYLFHRSGWSRPDDPESGSPDEYTMQFYVDIRARGLRRLKAVEKNHGQEGATEWAMQLARASEADVPDRHTITLRLQEDRFVALAQLLFPRGPEVMELDTTDSPFGNELRQFLTRLDRSTLARDLHSVPL